MRLLIAAGSAALLLIACGSGSDASPTTAPPASAAPSTTSDVVDEPTSTASVSTTLAPSAPIVTIPFAAPSDDICELTGTPGPVGQIDDLELEEVSGVVASRAHPGIVWVHNDSGGGPVVYGLDLSGAVVSRATLADTLALDWEDIGIGSGPEPGVDYLYVGDIGDNLEIRNFVNVYRFREPDPGSASHSITDVERFRIAYPDGPEDAEGLAVDPVSGDLLIATKTRTGGSILAVAVDALLPDEPVTAERRATLDLGGSITALDISADGSTILARGYETVWAWTRTAPDIGAVIGDDPCELPAPQDERQGEAIAALGGGFVTISEGLAQAINQLSP